MFLSPYLQILAALFAVLLAIVPAAHVQANRAQRIVLRAERSDASDLEVGGDVAGIPAGETRYISLQQLLSPPQQRFTVSDDANFAGSTQISGVALETLLRDLSASPNDDLIAAICTDKYRAHYTREYLARHHPVLVLEINGKPPSGWPKDASTHMGPYMISHAKFVPAFTVLADPEEPQIPWGVVRLEFRNETAVMGAITPRGPDANAQNVRQGFRIAQQNCFKCHNMDGQGGEKSGVAWTALAAVAKTSPKFFAEYVRDPLSKNPHTQMEGNPGFDDATLQALIDYFRTFAPGTKP